MSYDELIDQIIRVDDKIKARKADLAQQGQVEGQQQVADGALQDLERERNSAYLQLKEQLVAVFKAGPRGHRVKRTDEIEGMVHEFLLEYVFGKDGKDGRLVVLRRKKASITPSLIDTYASYVVLGRFKAADKAGWAIRRTVNKAFKFLDWLHRPTVPVPPNPDTTPLTQNLDRWATIYRRSAVIQNETQDKGRIGSAIQREVFGGSITRLSVETGKRNIYFDVKSQSEVVPIGLALFFGLVFKPPWRYGNRPLIDFFLCPDELTDGPKASKEPSEEVWVVRLLHSARFWEEVKREIRINKKPLYSGQATKDARDLAYRLADKAREALADSAVPEATVWDNDWMSEALDKLIEGTVTRRVPQTKSEAKELFCRSRDAVLKRRLIEVDEGATA